ncbi:MAG: HEAT repeat domain-containing protein [Planctomycetota bacterium]
MIRTLAVLRRPAARSAVALLTLLTVLSPGLSRGLSVGPNAGAGDRSARDRVSEIWAVIQDRGDKTPRGLFDELGQIGTPQALHTLERSIDELRRVWSKKRAFAAMGHFMGDAELRPKALNTLEFHAKGSDEANALAASQALAAFGEVAYDSLYVVARTARDDRAKAFAVGGLAPELVMRNDAASLELVLDGWITPHSGSRDRAVAVLWRFQSQPHFDRMARFVGSKTGSYAMRRFVLVTMENHPRGESANLDVGVEAVLEKGAQSKDPALRYHALRAMNARGGTDHMRMVERLAEDREPTVRRIALEMVARAGVRGFDPAQMAQSRDEIKRQAASVGLAELGTPAAMEALHELLTDDDPTVRAEAILQVGRRRDRSSIPFLIDRLEHESGRLKRDAWYSLTVITGKDLGLRVGSWRSFWRKEGESFVVPPWSEVVEAAARREASRESNESQVAFYGLEIISNRFALVVDTSGSMKEQVYRGKTRLDVAKEQLEATLSRIGEGVLFNIVPFAGAARPMDDGLLEMDEIERENASLFVSRLRADGGTNVYDALAAAFDDDRVDTIYLLTDGDPSVGEITDVPTLREEIVRWNSVRGVRIHCIAVGKDSALLKGIAEDSRGEYVRVD